MAKTLTRLTMTLMLVSALSGCGQKGDLYLPAHSASDPISYAHLIS